MAHTRAERRWFRYVKGMRRLREDRQQHSTFGQQTLEEASACFADRSSKEFGRIFARLADYPKVCGGYCCANPRRVMGEVTLQEKKADLSWEDW